MATKLANYSVPSATDILPELWEAGAFKAARTIAEIIEELATREYHFTEAAVGMALMRAKFLTRLGKKGEYRYIQIGPFRKA